MRLDIEESAVDTVYVSVWASPHLPLHMGKTENVCHMVDDHFGRQLQVLFSPDRLVAVEVIILCIYHVGESETVLHIFSCFTCYILRNFCTCGNITEFPLQQTNEFTVQSVHGVQFILAVDQPYYRFQKICYVVIVIALPPLMHLHRSHDMVVFGCLQWVILRARYN